MKSRRQAIQLCLDFAIVVIFKIVYQFPFEVFHGLKFLEVKQFTFKQAKEILRDCIILAITLAAHALP